MIAKNIKLVVKNIELVVENIETKTLNNGLSVCIKYHA